MKMIIKTGMILLTIISAFLMPLNVYATSVESTDDLSAAYGELYDALPKDIISDLEQGGYKISSLPELIDFVSGNGIGAVKDILVSKIKLPFGSMLTVIILCTLSTALSVFITRSEMKKTADIIFSLTVCLAVVIPIKSIVLSVKDCINTSGIFMFSFLPLFAAFLTISQQNTAAITYSSLTYVFTQFYVYLAKSVITPLTSAYFAFSISSVISGDMFKDILASVKKTMIWTLSLITTLFAATTSIQSVISSASDSVAMRAGKFIFGTTIPVVGGYVSEVLDTVIGGITIMRSGLGLFAIIVIVITFVPLLLELTAWKIASKLCAFIISGESATRGVSVINAFDDVLTLLITVIVCIMVGMILSLSAMLTLGGVK